MSMRHSAASNLTPADRGSFAEDVAYYLTQRPRQLPSRYLYDALGSALFDAICELPWYGITRAERRLLRGHAAEILGLSGAVRSVIELGPGNGEKLDILLRAPTAAGRNLAVHLVDVSADALSAAARALTPYPGVTTVLHEADYDTGLARVRTRGARAGRTLALCLGSNIGNFDPPAAASLLGQIRAALAPRDTLLLGADLVKPVRDLLLAYDDPLGVTAAFNRNLLVRANRELGATFDVAAFAHRAVWNAAASRVEMHLVSMRAQRARVPAARLDLTFAEGDTIWTESSYKYRPPAIASMLAAAHFDVAGQWIEDGFALTLARAVAVPRSSHE